VSIGDLERVQLLVATPHDHRVVDPDRPVRLGADQVTAADGGPPQHGPGRGVERDHVADVDCEERDPVRHVQLGGVVAVR
jgi:hypothetical protein